MNALAVIRRLHHHRNWVNLTLLAAVEDLAPDQLRQGFAIGQGSVWRTLTHLYAAEYVWLGTLEGDPTASLPGDVPGELPGNQKGEGAITTLQELETAWRSLMVRWRDYLETLTESSLDEAIPRVSSGSPDGKPRYTTRADILLHVCTHAHYTTAQLINMLRQLGVAKLPDPMLITMARTDHPDNER